MNDDALYDGFEHGVPREILRYPVSGTDRSVILIETRYPAAFFTIEVRNRRDELVYALGTGAGEGVRELAMQVVRLMAKSMFGLKEPGDYADCPVCHRQKSLNTSNGLCWSCMDAVHTCPSCGRSWPDAQSPWKCPSCGNEVEG